MRRTHTAWIVITGLLLGAGAAQEDVAALRQKYEASLGSLEDARKVKRRAWPEEYRADLGTLQKRKQVAGDLEGWQAVQAEIKRFRESQEIPESGLVSEPADLRALQERHRGVLTDYEAEHARKVLVLTGRYVERLEAMKTSLTKAGRIEDALATKAEIGRANTCAPVTAAKFVLADVGSKRDPDPGTAAKSPARPAAVTVLGQAPVGVQVFSGGKTPPASRLLNVKPASLMPTRHMPTGEGETARVAATASLCWPSRSGGLMKGRPIGKVKRMGTETWPGFRVALRTVGDEGILQKPTVVIEYCARKQGRLGVLHVQKLPLSHLDKDQVVVDCKTIRKLQVGPLEGVITTVLDADGSLLYQGASSRVAMGLAKPAGSL
jgi:hypothetical protein